MMRFCGLVCVALIVWTGCREELSDRGPVFRYNQPNYITSLDPAFARSQNNIWAVHHLFQTLVTLDDSLQIKPAIARAWKIEDEGRRITFYLRNDVYFHPDPCFKTFEERKLKAADVEYSLNRLLDTAVNSPGSWLFADKVGTQRLFSAVDDTTFVIRLNSAFTPILGLLTMQYCSVVSKKAVETYGPATRNHPVGSGPFKFKRWEEDTGLFLERYDDFAGEKAKIPFVKTTFIPDKQIAVYELLNGKCDFVSGIESSFIHELLTREGELKAGHSDKIRFYKSPYLNMEYLGINLDLANDHPYLGKKEFRQALNYAIDKETMMHSLRNNIGHPAVNGFIPRGLPGFEYGRKIGYSYDPAKADSLLKAIGYDGSEISLFTNNEYLDICTYVASQWEKAGIRTEINVLESAALRDGMRKSSIPIFRASWIADYPDAESFLCVFYGGNPAPPNYTRFVNQGYDYFYQLALREADTEKRLKLYSKLDSIVIEEAPVVFLFYDESSVFCSKDVEGFKPNGLNLLDINFELKRSTGL